MIQTDTGQVGERIFPNYDGGSQRRVTGATVDTLISGRRVGMEQPAGLDLHDGTLYVSDHANSTIYAFSVEGEWLDRLDLSGALGENGEVMGLEMGPNGSLYVATGSGNRVLRISAK